MFRRDLFVATVVGLTVIPPTRLEAQYCFGLPANSSLSMERSVTTLGSSLGAGTSLVGNRMALRLTGGKTQVAPTFDGFSGELRFALQQRVSRVSLCPVLEVGYLNASQDRAGLTTPAVTGLTMQTAAVRGGLAAGVRHELPRGIGIVPFVAARYEFAVLYLDPKVNASAGGAEAVGDTLSAVDIAYGATVTYKQWHAGWRSHRSSERPGSAYSASFFVGFAWGARGKK